MTVICFYRPLIHTCKKDLIVLFFIVGEEVLLIQEKLDGIKTRYSDIIASSGKALRTLEQALQLASKFQTTHEELTNWLGQVEEELAQTSGQSPTGDQIPQFQQRQKVINWL